YPLPESQLDRFMLRIVLTYPVRESELAVLERYGGIGQNQEDAATASAAIQPVVTPGQIEAARRCADQVHVAPELRGYVLQLAQATREHPQIALGLSTRGALALVRAARIEAALRGAEFVSPDDIKMLLPLVVPHRLVLSSEAVLEGISETALTQ